MGMNPSTISPAAVALDWIGLDWTILRAIIPDVPWIGHAGDARDLNKIMEMRIELRINLAIKEPPVVLPRDVAYLRFLIHDGEGNCTGM